MVLPSLDQGVLGLWGVVRHVLEAIEGLAGTFFFSLLFSFFSFLHWVQMKE